MKKRFSASWKGSKAPRKQRKYRHNAPLHVRGDFIHARLSKELAAKHKAKRARVRVGDKVKVMRGKFRGSEGKVELLNLKKSTAKITGLEVSKKDGSKAKVPVHVSNLLIVDLNLDDKKRMESKEKSAQKEK
jgi:large subunit ribosomal protein L24